MRNTELLLPAGSLETLKTAVRYGADAVYIGGERYSLRAKAHNFTPADMREGIAYAHQHGCRVYVAVNIFAHNDDIDALPAYLEQLREAEPDALIVSDPGVFLLARRLLPEMELHVSTQANNTNYQTFRFWHTLGAKRVVAARELTLTELAEIRSRIPAELELEAFVHGAMCISYSGRCLLSNYLTGRDANRGACTHPCRWKYALAEESRPGEYLPLEEDERGSYILNSGDLCMIGHIPELLAAGIDSFKIEGRMKTALYIAAAARTYRQAIDDCRRSEEDYRRNLGRYREEIAKCTHRQFTTGFYFGRPGAESQIYDTQTYQTGYTYIGMVQAVGRGGRIRIEQKNKFRVGETIEAMLFDGSNRSLRVREITDEAGVPMEAAPHPKQRLLVDLGEPLPEGCILRRREADAASAAPPL